MSAAETDPYQIIVALTARVAALEAELDAVRTELMHAIETMPPGRLARYVKEREARGGVMP